MVGELVAGIEVLPVVVVGGVVAVASVYGQESVHQPEVASVEPGLTHHFFPAAEQSAAFIIGQVAPTPIVHQPDTPSEFLHHLPLCALHSDSLDAGQTAPTPVLHQPVGAGGDPAGMAAAAPVILHHLPFCAEQSDSV